MIAARFRIELPPETWILEISEGVPDATFRLLAGVRADATAVELGEVTHDDPGAVGDAIEAHPSIVDYEQLAVEDGRGLATYETTDTGLYEFVAAASVPVEYPVLVENGWYEFDFVGGREAFDRFGAGLDELDRSAELLSLVHGDDGTGLLTDRQREVLNAGLREGYFETPRECTLAELAAALDVDKSTASRVLRRGQSTIVAWYLTTADRPSRGTDR
ncbi:Bacterio-opsin activator HTH domain-containing protein [Halovivax asiaticus JCM 14624]|uniref:Bacterio-opsin activator HTH domain-containing protein n=1 Tax=Halovivax asiaticus JCM 14624 TaxID=1227490 RepID=M0BN57_9EURY|nr:helix-turn-helix domain-containing protein [Halovivax asiaticus]ELZ11024.1 Bacterio-opsin activator HTH domain-containing protein [Halovivax asiaticus JCM 14624]